MHVGHEFIEGLFYLLPECLLYVDSETVKPISITYIKWKRIEPFTEIKNGTERFGFRLYGSKKAEDFYVPD
jgi:hypothetical protein